MARERVILVLDDEPNILRTLRLALPRGVPRTRVVCAARPQEAFGLLRAEAPDIVLSDHHLPEMTGVEFLARVREVAPRAVLTLMTGQAEERLAIRAINEAHVAHFFTKPFDLDEMAAIVARLLDERERADAALSAFAQQFHSHARAVSP